MSKHHIFPGSITVGDTFVTAGVHMGPSEYQPVDLRYVRAKIPTNPDPSVTVQDLMTSAYENSTGCLVHGTFNPTAEPAA